MKSFLQFITENKKQVNKKLLDQYGKYKIYLVNGEEVRNLTEKDEEFGLSSSYPYFPNLIPKHEIWIEDSVKENERQIIIYSELYKLKLIEDGVEKWEAYHNSENKVKKLRESSKISKHTDKNSDKPSKNIYIKEWGKIGDLTIWLIDAKKVRNEHKSDFMEGGHDYVYNWIPENEIWIEDGLNEHEIPFIILHEMVERTLMKGKMKYDDAHDIASKVEWDKRPNDCKKQYIDNINEDEVLKLIKKFKNNKN